MVANEEATANVASTRPRTVSRIYLSPMSGKLYRQCSSISLELPFKSIAPTQRFVNRACIGAPRNSRKNLTITVAFDDVCSRLIAAYRLVNCVVSRRGSTMRHTFAGREVDDEIELGRLRDWKIGGPSALKNLVSVNAEVRLASTRLI